MKKINKNSINYGLKILTVLAFVLIFVPFNKASAQYYNSSVNCYGANSYYYGTVCSGESAGNGSGNTGQNLYYNNTNPPYQPPIYTAPAPAQTPVVYSTSTNPNGNVMTVNYTPKAATKTKAKTASTTAPTNPNGNALAANAVYGSNSFLPSGLIQWVLFAIFILLLIILVRTLFGAKEEYHASPLKHE